MKRFDSHPEEALELEKQGALPEPARAALLDHLRECSACRAELWAHGHTPFRIAPNTDSDAASDRLAIAGVLDALKHQAARRARVRRALPLMLGLALPLSALAAVGLRYHRVERPVPASAIVHSVAPAPAPAPASASAPPTSSDSVPTSEPVPEPAPSVPSSAAPESTSAAGLFRRAAELKRAGQSGRAVGVYRELQTRFASSPEAQLSYVIAGDLLLEQGKAAAAIAQFDRYLGTSGPASEEALVGRAQALQRLGRTGEEAAAWQQLLARFPASVHARAARERLTQLGSGAAPSERP